MIIDLGDNITLCWTVYGRQNKSVGLIQFLFKPDKTARSETHIADFIIDNLTFVPSSQYKTKIRWFHRSENEYGVVLHSIGREDVGMYICKYYSFVGEGNKTAEIKVILDEIGKIFTSDALCGM